MSSSFQSSQKCNESTSTVNDQLNKMIQLIRGPNSQIQIPYPEKFISALEELQSLIGMDSIKAEIIKQIQFILQQDMGNSVF